MYVHIHIHDPLQDVYQVEKIKSGPLFLPSINDLQVVVLHPANRKSGMAEILDRQSRTSMEVSVFCPSALTQIQSWSGLGLSNPVEKICGSIGDHHSNSNKITNNGSEREEKLSRPRVRLAHAMDPFGGCPSCFMNNLGNRQRIIQDEKPSQAVLSVAGRCWKMLEARSFSHHPHHHTPGSVQILILDARVLIFYLLMPWWLRVVPWNHGLLDLWKDVATTQSST